MELAHYDMHGDTNDVKNNMLERFKEACAKANKELGTANRFVAKVYDDELFIVDTRSNTRYTGIRDFNQALERFKTKLRKKMIDRRNLKHDDFIDLSEDDLNHYGVLGMKWGQHLFGKDKNKTWSNRPKYTKEENKTRKDLVRGVTAAQRNLKDRRKLAKTAEMNLVRAKKENKAARQMVVLPWNKSKKREIVAETERFVQEAMKDLEIPTADMARAKTYVKKQTKALQDFAEQMNSKYGAENIKQLKYKDSVTRYEDGYGYVDKFVKTGVNMANFPVICNWISANYITAWEDADREDLLKKRSEQRLANSY